jgi:hypothetical protein
MNLPGAGPAQGAGALVDGRARRIDVVDERQGARPGTGREGAADVAAAALCVESSLRAHTARARHQRDDRQLPPAREASRQLRGRIRPAQEQPVAHGRHHDDRVDARPRQLVRHERGRETPGRDLAALPACHQMAYRAVEPECRARRREPAQTDAPAARHHGDRSRGAAARAERRGERAHQLSAPVAHPIPGCPTGHAAAREHEPDERGERCHATRLGPVGVACPCRNVPQRLRLQRRAGSP